MTGFDRRAPGPGPQFFAAGGSAAPGYLRAQMKTRVDSIESALTDIRRGKMVIVVDDEDRENEGDLIMAAEKATPQAINFMARFGRGLICVPTTAERLAELGIERMVANNRETFKTDFQVSVDAAKGIASGISAADRARTVELMVDPATKPLDLVQPGHIFPLRAKEGGVLQRAGHAEAAVDLARFAGFKPVGVICEVMSDDGTMARLPELGKFAKKHKLKVCTIQDLISYRRRSEKLIERIETIKMPTDYGDFNLHLYQSTTDGQHHLALVKGKCPANATSSSASTANASPATSSRPAVAIAARSCTRRCSRSPMPVAGSSSTCARKGAASDCPRRSAPTSSRKRASTRCRPT
jgi:3,4-dihydroxy-2-butanone 4-phosphate synthase